MDSYMILSSTVKSSSLRIRVDNRLKWMCRWQAGTPRWHTQLNLGQPALTFSSSRASLRRPWRWTIRLGLHRLMCLRMSSQSWTSQSSCRWSMVKTKKITPRSPPRRMLGLWQGSLTSLMGDTPNRPNSKQAKTHTTIAIQCTKVAKTNLTSKANLLPEEQIPNRASEPNQWQPSIYKHKVRF